MKAFVPSMLASCMQQKRMNQNRSRKGFPIESERVETALINSVPPDPDKGSTIAAAVLAQRRALQLEPVMPGLQL